MAIVPPIRVDAHLSHLEYPSNVFGFAIDPLQPVWISWKSALRGATLCLFPLVCHGSPV